MYQFRTDALSVAMIVGGAVVAGGATILLAGTSDRGDVSLRCESAAEAPRHRGEQRHAVVALGHGSNVVTFAPRAEAIEGCESTVRVTDVTVRRPEVVVVGQLARGEAARDRARAERDRERAQRDRERAERDLERAEREVERSLQRRQSEGARAELRAREVVERVQRRSDRDRVRDMERAERALARAQARIEGTQEDGRYRFRGDIDFEHDPDFDFDFDFDVDFDDMDFDFDFDDMNVAVEFDGENMMLDIEGMEQLHFNMRELEEQLEGLGLRIEGELADELGQLDRDIGPEVERRIEDAMRELEERLSRMDVDRRRGGGY